MDIVEAVILHDIICSKGARREDARRLVLHLKLFFPIPALSDFQIPPDKSTDDEQEETDQFCWMKY